MKVKEVTGVVLAGGQSRRMGADKASLVLGGKPMISHAIDRLRTVLPEVVVVAKDACRLDLPGVRVIADASKDKTGALVGIYSALLAVKTPYAFVVACDMPYIRPELVLRMIESCQGCDAFVPKIGAEIEPLFALYSRACLPSIEARLDAGDFRVRGFFEDVNTLYLQERFLRDADPGLSSFVNINTREDLEKAQRVMGQTAQAESSSYRMVRIAKYKEAGEESEVVSESEDAVIAETQMAVLLNGKPLCSIRCSPHDLESLAAGHLLSEGYIGPRQRIVGAVSYPGTPTSVEVKVEDAGEGLGAEEVAATVGEADLHVSPKCIYESMEELLKKSPLFGLTGAAHAAALCSGSGIVYWSEDVSRHNAVDRVAGQCFLAGDTFSNKFLVTTGRINGEMVEKASSCGINLVASKAPPTDRGILLAEKLGITVVGFVRNRRFNVYTQEQRLS